MENVNSISSGSLNASQRQCSRHVSLTNILSDKYRPQSGDYIEINVVHSFYVEKHHTVECHFIFADQETHISAILFHRPGGNIIASSLQHSPSPIFEKLKEGTRHRIKYFEILRDKIKILLNQMRRLKLRNRTQDIEQILEDTQFPLLQHIPFQFTKLERLDQCRGKVTDLLGYVKNAEHKVSVNGISYQVVEFITQCPSREDSPVMDKQQHVYIVMFGHFAEYIFVFGCLYAISNISVKDTHSYYPLNITTSHRSIVVKITRTSIEKVLNNQSLTELVSDLEPYLNSTDLDEFQETIVQSTRRNDDIDDEYLSRSLSQSAITGNEPVTTVMLTNEQAPSVPPPLLVSGNTPPRQTLALVSTHASACITPTKRTLSMNSLASISSPSKKTKQTSPHAAISSLQLVSIDSRTDPLSPQQFYDCINQYQPYNVVVSPSPSFMDTKQGSYSMRSEVRGMALIINNFFPDTSKEREGSFFDVMYLTEYLEKCSFKVSTVREVASWNYGPTIRDFKNKVSNFGPEKIDSLFIAVLSHGFQGAVEMADEVNIPVYNDLIQQFDEFSFPCLAGKPKIFLINTCQSLPTIESLRLQRNVMTPPTKTIMKNMIVCCSTCPGLLSYRDKYLGSYFIYVLVDILMKHSHNTHFEKMLRLVQYALQNVKCDVSDELTCAYTPFRFEKMYFNPGL